MFEIKKIVLISNEGESYTYDFKKGLNYFKGTNSSGKTEFYNFIDYMFGSSENISRKPWYSDSLKEARMTFIFNNIEYKAVRSINSSECKFGYSDFGILQIIDLKQYKEKLNSVFTKDVEYLKSIREFAEEDLTYRTFTLFNFLGEKRQGTIQDFFDKCSEIKYATKLPTILNYIFNKNLERIYDIQFKLKKLSTQLKKIENDSLKYDFINKQVNYNLKKLDIGIVYNRNKREVIEEINKLKKLEQTTKRKNTESITKLEFMYNNVTEQIKIYENKNSSLKQIEKNNKNRVILLKNLEKLLNSNQDFAYLVTPLKDMTSNLETTISFGNYLLNDKAILELKKQRDFLKAEIVNTQTGFQMYSLMDKEKAIAVIEDYLSEDIKYDEELMKKIRNEINELKKELKLLQNTDDVDKIESLSTFITNIYKSAKNISSVVNADIKQNEFRINYLKKGNILQPSVLKSSFDIDKDENERENYYIGSMARHTLIQLSGYLGFLDMLLSESKYPLIPILVIDHISQTFDQDNMKALGSIIDSAYQSIGKDNLQIFMFDDEKYENLNIKPDNFVNLITSKKTGFNPFYSNSQNLSE